MNLNRVYFFALGVVVMASCSSNNEVEIATNSVAKEINLAAGIEAMSARAATNVLDTRFIVNNRLAIYINEVTSETPSVVYSQPMQYTVYDKNGNIKPTSETVPYYPTSGNDVTIEAFYPYSAISPSGAYTFNTDQSESTGYQACDLMYAKVRGRNTSGAMNLSFKHLTSKITFHLTTSDENIILSSCRVKLLNVKRTTDIDPRNGTLAFAYGDTSEPILISKDGSKDGSAVILPQTISANTRFIEIELLTKEKVYGIMPTTYTFEPGTSYMFNIDVQVDRVASTLTLSDIQIVDWVDEYSAPQEIEGERTN